MQTAELEKDLSYFHSLYSPLSARILGIVIAEVNRAAYPNSFLFDEYPDALTLERMAQKILYAVGGMLAKEAAAQEEFPFSKESAIRENPLSGSPSGQPWLMLLVKALLFDEIVQLRRRNRG